MKIAEINFKSRVKAFPTTKAFYIIFLLGMFGISCTTESPNTNERGEDILSSHETVISTISKSQLHYVDTLYVPIYSDIYVNATNTKNLLAATLSLRNTSMTDSLYISMIDYFDTGGEKVRSYIDRTLLLEPLQSIDYVIEREDEVGGSGANFIIALSAKKSNMKPIIQAVMVGYDGNKGFAFTTDGYSIKN